MAKIAIIGTGIAGLGCAHFLHARHDLSLFEQNDYVGGHTNTVTIDENGTPVPIDTGFMVFNEVTYPNLTRLFKELGVAAKPTNMSFSVQHLPTGLEFCGSSLNHLFGQRKNLVRPRFWKMIMQINRFNQEAVETLKTKTYDHHTLGQYVREKNYGDDFLNFYLVPMSSAPDAPVPVHTANLCIGASHVFALPPTSLSASVSSAPSCSAVCGALSMMWTP